jgi:hypothetical protein
MQRPSIDTPDRRRPRRSPGVLVLIAALSFTGCGGGDDPGDSPATDALAPLAAQAIDAGASGVTTVAAVPTAASGTAPSPDASIAIRRQPVNVAALEGRMARFSVEADGPPTMTYQWRRDDKPITGGAGPVLQLLVTQADHLARISVVVSDGPFVVQSNPAVLRVERREH